MAEYSSLQDAYRAIGTRRADRPDRAAHRRRQVSPTTSICWPIPHWPCSPATSRHGHRRPTAARGWTEFRAPEPLPDATKPAAAAGDARTHFRAAIVCWSEGTSATSTASPIRSKTAVISGVALIFVLAAVASILVTRRTVGRIEAINATSRAIMQSGLDERIPLRGTNDEWDRVAENLNLMLDRIETLMGEVKQVSDNVAHDLRTPLTRMRGRLEKAYHGQRVGEDDQSLIGDTIADLDAVLRIFSSITRIAQIETQAAQGRVPHREPGRNRRRGCRAVRCRGRAGRHPSHHRRRSRGAGDRRSRPDL